MSVGKALISLVILLLVTAAAWVIGGFLITYIGNWGIFIGLVLVLFNVIYIMDRHNLTEYIIIPVIVIAIAIAWMIGGTLTTYIGDWGIFAGIIILLVEMAVIAYSQGWSLDNN